MKLVCTKKLVLVMMKLGPLFGGPEEGFGPNHNRPPRGNFFDDGTRVPQATGFDELYPEDCGRHPHDGTGKLCMPDGLLCQESE